LPFSPGGEVAGTVAALGSGVAGFFPGQRVLAYLGWNGCREFALAPADRIIALADGVTDEAAAALPIAYGTALHGLVGRAGLKSGETLLVLGATGGTGLAAVEIGARFGAKVIAAGTSDEKLKICAERGASHLLNLASPNLKETLANLTGGKGVDVVYDPIGGPYAEPALRAMAWEGRYLVVGFAAGEIPKIPLNLVLLKGCEIAGVFWGRHVDLAPSVFRDEMRSLVEWCAKGELHPHIDRVFSLEETAQALQMMEDRQIKGKVIVKPWAPAA
jgi:NADPH2:quinone reductase